MRRLRFGTLLAAAALASAVAIPLTAAPAGAVVAASNSSGFFPNMASAISGVKANVTTAAGDVIDSLVLHDAVVGRWHNGSARTLTTTAGSAVSTSNLVFAAGKVSQADLARPISSAGTTPPAVPITKEGGTFVTAVLPAACTTACTTLTVSQTHAVAVAVGQVFTIEHTRNRVLTGVTCPAGAGPGTVVITRTGALFTADDINRSVSGGPFKTGAKITAVGAAPGNTATVTNVSASIACQSPSDIITIGGQYCAAGAGCNPGVDPLGTDTRELMNSTGPPPSAAWSCAVVATKATITSTVAGFKTNDVKLPVKWAGTGAATTTEITAITATTATTAAAACPAGVSTSVGWAAIGAPNRSAPNNGATMAQLSAELNLSDFLVVTQDNCANSTFEGFQVFGGWQNPGAYPITTAGSNAKNPVLSIAQVLFPTAVLSFQGFIVPKPAGDTPAVQVGAHYDFTFPALPTTSAVCQSGTPLKPTNGSALSLGFTGTTQSGPTFTKTGTGNPGSPGVRSLDSRTGPFSMKIQSFDSVPPAAPASHVFTPTACTVLARTATPAFGTCGDG